MRTWVVAFALAVAACKGGKKKEEAAKPVTPGEVKASSGLVAPKVDVATVLAKEEPKQPPYLLIVDDKSELRLAAAATWADLDANKLRISKKAMPIAALDPIDRFTREEFGLGRMGEMAVESIQSWDEVSPETLDLAALEDKPPAGDDPPPPEEADGEESGGTGTAMAMDEGKMGKVDADRAPGQYQMKKTQDDPQLARQQAIEQARAAGILGGDVHRGGPGFGPGGEGPGRGAQVGGVVAEDGKLARPRMMVLVPPAMKAPKLVDILSLTRAALAVAHGGKIRPLRLDFDIRDGAVAPDGGWLEARVSTKGIAVEAVPDKPIEVADVAGIAAALDQARKARGMDAAMPVDVLVDPDVDAQRLVDVLVALDVAGVRAIGLGPALPPEELAFRGKRIPRAIAGQPNAQGDLDKALIRRVVKGSLDKVTACYTQALAGNETLAGTVAVLFFIEPSGKVKSVSASGVDPKLADCVAKVVKALTFPKPAGGGGVQVNYPFDFRT